MLIQHHKKSVGFKHGTYQFSHTEITVHLPHPGKQWLTVICCCQVYEDSTGDQATLLAILDVFH